MEKPSLPRSCLDELAACPGERITVPGKEKLIEQGAPNTCFFRFVKGSAVIQLKLRSRRVSVACLEPGDWVGAVGCGSDDTFFFNLVCLSECEFEQYQWPEVIERLSTLSPLERYFDYLAHSLRIYQLLVQSFDKAYRGISVAFLQDIIQRGRFIELQENEKLFEEGDTARAMYFLLSGKIDVYVGRSGSPVRVGQIYRGEPFGEMSLFTGENRSATLVASRACHLISLDRESFDHLSARYPQLSTYIVTSLIGRIKKQNEQHKHEFKPVNRFILYFSSSRSRAAATRIADLLARAEVNVLSGTSVLQRFNQADFSGVSHSRLADYLEQVEHDKPKNFYISDSGSPDWIKVCLERSDEIWFIVDSHSDAAELNAVLAGYNRLFGRERQKRMLVLVRGAAEPITGTAAWLKAIDARHHFHLEQGNRASERRLLRFMTDQSLGMVLGGGGARGFAQIGVIRAFEEAGIDVDWIGGTSIGSIIGGWLAMGWNSESIEKAVHRFFVSVNPLGDYTLPLISLSKSRRLDALLREGFGTVQIEDLPLPYFCVSSDMSLAEERHHESGVLWQAIRASISIPGVIAPVIEGGHFLVDGGLLNNLPCDLMCARNNGPVVAVDVSPDEAFVTQLETLPSPWQVLKNKLLGHRQPGVASILETMLRSSLLASVKHQKSNRELVDFYVRPDVSGIGMLEFRKVEMAIEAGYREGVQTLDAWRRSGKTFSPAPAPDE
ncbi:MAG: hypothetical protein CSB48_03290 [Proteobacteria bacterium]|nr:MAG: hypothetical protein CSB48_03290 [Pseudomonadota bacterium]